MDKVLNICIDDFLPPDSVESDPVLESSTTESYFSLITTSDGLMALRDGKHLLEADDNSDTGLSSLHSSSDEACNDIGTLV